MTIPDSLPQLAVGSHDAGSGQACVMNAISYINGDTIITDMPDCAYPLLARIAIKINDTVCSHRSGDLLCPECSHGMWRLGARIIGTAGAVSGWTDEQRRVLNVRLAVTAARAVLHMVRPQHREVCEAAIDAAEAWDDEPTEENRKAASAAAAAAASAAAYAYASAAARAAAYAAAYAAYASARAARAAAYAASASASAAAYAASAAASAAYAAARAAYAAARAASASAAAADPGAAKLNIAHKLIDEFEQLTDTKTHRQWTHTDYATVRTGMTPTR